MTLTILMVLLLFSNIIMINYFMGGQDKSFEVELNRVHNLLVNRTNKQLDSATLDPDEINVDIRDYKYIVNVDLIYTDNMPTDKVDEFYKFNGSEYRIYPIIREDRVISYVRIDYKTDSMNVIRNMNWFMNSIILLMIVILTIVYVYMGKQIIKPFHQISELPYELSKGHITKDIKESQNRFFGKFIWGLNLLRENLEELKKKELELVKDKKLMILSISHDIKTPLSAIKLYARALIVNLYDTEEKKQEIARNIEEKSNEIEKFVAQIIEQTKTNFLHINVVMGEFYLEDLINHIKYTYSEKLKLLKTTLEIDSYTNCMLKGDMERLIEAIQNIIENAIKYGDGTKISLDFMEEENYLLISITNWGNTLPDTEIVHIFESFYRGTNSYEKTGSGLGLYICKEILNRMDGELYAQATGDKMSITIVVERL
jgi:signal transduction histidine kinase